MRRNIITKTEGLTYFILTRFPRQMCGFDDERHVTLLRQHCVWRQLILFSGRIVTSTSKGNISEVNTLSVSSVFRPEIVGIARIPSITSIKKAIKQQSTCVY